MNVRSLVRFLRTSWLLIGVFAVAGTAVAGRYTANQAPRYEATAQLYVSMKTPELVRGSSFDSLTRQISESFVEVATTPRVLNPVIKTLGLKETASSLRDRVSVTVAPVQVVILIQATDPAPERAANIANALSEQLVKTVRTLTPSGSFGPEVRLTPVAPATPPTSPSAPYAPVALALGLLMGAALGVLAAALRNRSGGGGMRALRPQTA